MNIPPGRPRNRRRLSSFSRNLGLGALVLLPAGGTLYMFLPRLPVVERRAGSGRAGERGSRGEQVALRKQELPPGLGGRGGRPERRTPIPQSDVTTEDQGAESRTSPESLTGLSEELRGLAREAPARAAAIYVQDIPTGRTATVNPDRVFVAASLIKLPVMGAVYERWQARPALKTNTVRWWLEQMITVSDNGCTNRLVDFVGGPGAVNRFSRERGWPHLLMRHTLRPYSGPRRVNQVTAREIGALLAALDRGKLVGERADAEMWGVLRRQKLRQRIPAGLPDLPDLEVGNKTGTLPAVLHDSAIIHTSRSRYALCILLSLPRSEAAGDRFCRLVSRRVFDRMEGEDGEVSAANAARALPHKAAP